MQDSLHGTRPAGPGHGRAPVTRHARAALVRWAWFAVIWLAMMPSARVADLTIGFVAAALATWASLRLLPPSAGRVHLGALLGFLPHFCAQSFAAGFDVARRAFRPRMMLRPGFVACPARFPAGISRNEFCIVVSLMPGTVPVGDGPGAILYHCLDASQPIAQQMAAEEALLADVFVPGDRHV